MRECLKREHVLSEKVIRSIFTNEHFLNDDNNFSIYSELICHLGEWDKNALVPYVNQSMNIIMAICTTDSNEEYCLALLYRVVTTLRELVDPFVHDIFKYALES